MPGKMFSSRDPMSGMTSKVVVKSGRDILASKGVNGAEIERVANIAERLEADRTRMAQGLAPVHLLNVDFMLWESSDASRRSYIADKVERNAKEAVLDHVSSLMDVARILTDCPDSFRFAPRNQVYPDFEARDLAPHPVEPEPAPDYSNIPNYGDF